MAKASLRAFMIDVNAFNDGEWIGLGEEFGEPQPEIKTRGFTDRYRDMQQARFRKASEPFRNNFAKIPEALQRYIVAETLIDVCLIDVRNITDPETGEDISFEKFCVMLKKPECRPLHEAVVSAVGQAGKLREAGLEEDAKNSSTPS